jgi:starch synthase
MPKSKPGMNILFVAAEMAPFAKTGGLADVVGALPQALARRGHRVCVVVPLYPSSRLAGIPLRRLRRSVTVPLGNNYQRAGICAAHLGGVDVWFLDLPALYDRSGLYGAAGSDYPDNHLRFAALCRGALALVKTVGFRPDVVHCHDWHAALVPAMLRWDEQDPFFAATGTVLTIHNLAFQGLFPPDTLAELGLPTQMDRAEFYGQISFLKAGLMAADKITTVSAGYRNETLCPELGCGLDGVLQVRSADYVGILNGIDDKEWNPATDCRLPACFSATSLRGKARCKAALQQLLGLPSMPEVPLLAVVSRLTEQKGCDLLLELLPRLAAAPLQLALLGTGDEYYMRAFQRAAAQRYRNISISLSFHPELGPLMYAGADLFLMPSRFEPCGIGQLIALKYGAVPVARQTGGLADTIIDAREPQGTGFLFADFTAAAFWQAIERAMTSFADLRRWRQIMRRGMNADFSWGRSVGTYENIYCAAMAQRREGRQ